MSEEKRVATAEILNTSVHVSVKLNDRYQGPPGPPGKDGNVRFEDLTEAQIEQLRGPQGLTGKTPQITVQVETGEPGTEASVMQSGTAEAPVIALTIPRGNVGATPQITVQVKTGEPGTAASVKQTGTTEAPVIELTIPRGDTGNIGSLTINGKTPDSAGKVELTAADVGALSGTDATLTQAEKAADAKATGDALNRLKDDFAPLIYNNAGAHNAVYRGKNLGTSVTDAQYAAIAAGTFDDLYIGDYWIINDVTYRIAAFDYYLRAGDAAVYIHHVTLVPDVEMYTHVMNDTDITTGGYVGSKMYTVGLNPAKTTITSAFGASHVLKHRQYLCNAVTNGKPSGGSWYDSTVELMTEQNCYGGKVFSAGNDGSTVPALYTVDKSQYPLFAFRPDMISNREWFWLRDVVSSTFFARVGALGNAFCASASGDSGVRPAFSIIG